MTALATGPSLDAEARVALHDHYGRVRDLTEDLAAPLSDEDQVVQSMPDVSPTKWHRAHTTWFFETFLLSPRREVRAVRPRVRVPLQLVLRSRRSASSAPATRLALPPVGRRRRPLPRARRRRDARPHRRLRRRRRRARPRSVCITSNSIRSCCSWTSSTCCTATRPIPPTRTSRTRRAARRRCAFVTRSRRQLRDRSRRLRLLLRQRMPAARRAPRADADRGPARLPHASTSSSSPTTDTAGPSSGSPTAGTRCRSNGWEAPLYWRNDGADGWSVFTLGGPPRRSTRTNPSCTSATTKPTRTRAGAATASPRSSSGSTRSRAAAPDTLGEIDDVAWQWTSSAYLPYPRFRPPAGAVGEYNGKFMSGQMTLRGGAAETSPGHTRVTYRNFFPPASRWMFGGLRLAQRRGDS